MSNHSGSYMLRDVLALLEKRGFFANQEPEAIQQFLNEVLKIGDGHDCNHGEILDGIGERIGVCYGCVKLAELDHGLCQSCRG